MKKCVVLSSGGLDSTSCVAYAVKVYGAANVISLSMYYGQKHDKELECARKVAEYFGIQHLEKDLTTVFTESNCSLLKQSTQEVAEGAYVEQLSMLDENDRLATYVPFRNGLFLSCAASVAMSLSAESIMYGAHADDAAGNAYPDCSVEFVRDMSRAILDGTGGALSLSAPLITKTKAEVVAFGKEYGAPFELTWSCYKGGDKQCGKCGTCIDRRKAFELNGMVDPVPYED